MTAPDPSADPPRRLVLTTLGAAALCRVRSGHEPELALDVGKPLALLTVLALARGRSTTRDHLVDLLWANLPTSKALAAVRHAIHVVREKLGGFATIDTEHDRVVLVAPVECDRDPLVAAGERDDFETVVRLYAGDFFPGFAADGAEEFERWAEGERLRLRDIHRHAAERLVRERLATGRDREALTLARRVRELDPDGQTGWRLVLESLAIRGSAPGLIVELDELDRLIAAGELEPEPPTLQIIERARKAARPAANASPDAESRVLVADLVGRERELAAVLGAVAAARPGRGVHLHLAAPAGLGKTRLLSDAERRLRYDKERVTAARAHFGARDTPYAFVSEIAGALATRSAIRAISPRSASVLVALNPTLSSYSDASPDSATGDESLLARALALRDLIEARGDDRTLVLLLDDLHWSDAYSLRVLETALDGIEKARLVVVSAGRTSYETHELIARATMLSLEPLSADAIAALVASLAPLPEEPWVERIASALRSATSGSPLLVLEMLQLLIDRALLERTDEGWIVRDADALFAVLAQGSALRHRVESLDVNERPVLLTLAVAGVPLAATRIARALAHEVSDVTTSLIALERRGLVARRGEAWTTAHDEHATTMLESSSPEEQRTAALALGRALADERSDDEPTLRLAARLLASGDDDALARVFERFVRARRRVSDRRSDHLLARDLLGPAATAERERRLVASLPVRVRLRLLTARRIAAAAAMVLLAPVAIGALVAELRAPAAPPPDIVLAAFRQTGSDSITDVFDIPVDASRWAGVGAVDAVLPRRPRWRMAIRAGYGSTLRSDRTGWTVGVAVPDTGIEDLFDVRIDGTIRRLTYAWGEDVNASWAPDASGFVFETHRWGRRSDLAIYDARTGAVRRLTAPDVAGGEAIWSLDGSRIAFQRRPRGSETGALCIIDTDGSHLRCPPVTLHRGAIRTIRGWTDSRHVLVELGASDSTDVARIDVDTGAGEMIEQTGPEASIGLSPDGRWIVCTCRRRGYARGSWLVYPIDRPNEFRVLRIAPGDTARLRIEWAPTARRAPFVDRLEISRGPAMPVLGAAHQLHAIGIDSSGHVAEPGVIRWRSLDTTMATVDSAGLLTPRHAGRIVIEASAGGWRRATAVLTVRASDARTLLDERWRDGFEPRWKPFGEPRPLIVRDTVLGSAMLNNGDGLFYSGAYTARAFDVGAGLSLDAELSSSIVAGASQETRVFLSAMPDSAAWARWDHTTTFGPNYGETCGITYPGDQGPDHGDSLGFWIQGPGPKRVPAPRGTRAGRPFRVTIQIFPDGRCAIAVDGRVIRTSVPYYDVPRAHVLITGNSGGTRMLVGRLRVSTGIAPEVRWER